MALTSKGEKVIAELALHHHEQLRTAGPRLVTALQKVQNGSRSKTRDDESPKALRNRTKQE